MEHHAILEGHEVKPADLMTWAQWFETADRHVDRTKIGDVEVSTVFLGLDHNIGGDCPHWYETMVFGGKYNGEQWRYTTWDEAVVGHNRAVAMVKDA